MADWHDPDDDDAAFLRDWNFLVVDDNPAALSILRSMLLMLGVKPPQEAVDGASAMELVQGNEFDCIITDVRMEPMSGAEFIRWVRRSNEAANSTVRILAMSAYRDAKEVALLEAEGANGFIGKPLSVPLLRAALEAVARDPAHFVEVDSTSNPDQPKVYHRSSADK